VRVAFIRYAVLLSALFGALGRGVVSAQAPQPDRTDTQTQRWPAPRFAGLVQVDATLLSQSSVDELDPATREPLNDRAFALRRARLAAQLSTGLVRGTVGIQASSVLAPLSIYLAELSLNYPAQAPRPLLMAAAGVFVIPFGLEQRELVATRAYLEPSQWVSALFPGRRDLGARVEARWRFLHALVAVMNGEPDERSVVPLRDTNAAKDFIARFRVIGSVHDTTRLAFGTSLLLGTGFSPGKRESKDALVWRDVNEDGVVQTSELQVIAGSAAEPSQNFQRFGIGVDAALSARLPVLGELNAFAELSLAKNLDRGLWPADPVAAGRDLRELGWAVGARQAITRHVEVGARYDVYDPDFDRSERRGTTFVPVDARFGTLSVFAALHTFQTLRLTVQYDHRRNPLGRTASGAEATLAADTLVVRAQLVF
jgi:hypothetical protein